MGVPSRLEGRPMLTDETDGLVRSDSSSHSSSPNRCERYYKSLGAHRRQQEDGGGAGGGILRGATVNIGRKSSAKCSQRSPLGAEPREGILSCNCPACRRRPEWLSLSGRLEWWPKRRSGGSLQTRRGQQVAEDLVTQPNGITFAGPLMAAR